jgi:integrase
MAKRGNGEGSISRRKDGLFMARYTVQTTDGPKRRTIYGKKGESREDVAAKLTKAMADRDGGIIYDAGKLTVEDHLLGWLSDSVRGKVRQRTFERYESIIRVHLIPALGRIQLKTLTPAQVRHLYRAKLDDGLAPAACSTSTGP